MKKLIAFVLSLVFMFSLTACRQSNTYKIQIIVPAGSTEAFVYSDDEISATGNKITISSGEGLGDTAVILHPVDETITPGYVATYLTPGMPVEFDAETGIWFKIGISMQNDTEIDKIVYVEVKGVDVRKK
jgi:hypothetical protein